MISYMKAFGIQVTTMEFSDLYLQKEVFTFYGVQDLLYALTLI
jgi:hypothetical protein